MNRRRLGFLGALLATGSFVFFLDPGQYLPIKYFQTQQLFSLVADVAHTGLFLGGLALLFAVVFPADKRIDVIWARLFLALFAGTWAGLGTAFLALGTLPEFKPIVVPMQQPAPNSEEIYRLGSTDEEIAWQMGQKRRLATSVGIGFLTGSVALLAVFSLSRRCTSDPNYLTQPVSAL